MPKWFAVFAFVLFVPLLVAGCYITFFSRSRWYLLGVAMVIAALAFVVVGGNG